MKQPKFYVIIKSGFWMAGSHGYQTKKNASAFADNWKHVMRDSGLDESAVNDAINVIKA